MAKQKKYIFVTGGVLSSIGKGIAAASMGMLMEQRGIKVTMIKMDPYLNVDPGTMSPFQHGEVFVLDDGTETDLDLGHYSRFVQSAAFTRSNSFTTGRIYDAVIRRERAGGYLGKTVQVIPHITDEIKSNIRQASADADLAIIEVGGTVGDIESLPFLEAIRHMKFEEGAANVLYIHLTLVPYMAAAQELKTKPTQHSVKELREIGIQPDLLLCRSDRKLPKDVKDKIGLFCNVPGDHVFSAIDVKSIYEVPLYFSEENLDERIVEKLGIWTGRPDLSKWQAMVEKIKNPKGEVTIGIVGKYTDWRDTYKSLSEALIHGGVAGNVRVNMQYVDSEEIEKGNLDLLRSVDGILVPGGFGERGIEGKIRAVEYARTEGIPFFGICLGMQLAVVEYARNMCGMSGAGSAEFKPGGTENVVDIMESQKTVTDKGGTMRLGAYACAVLSKYNGKPTRAFAAYGKEQINERHRHRFEVSDVFRSRLEEKGLLVSGRHKRSDGTELVEMVEIPSHPWFLGCQFHPEFLSRPLVPHPLFASFVKAAKDSGKGQQRKLKGIG
ncbi:MAG: CTP synthase [Bdellovibrionales bacterium RIFOXYD1_FULL_53_11]|nr:MAG: CTP synthase [Bdellovibrionales bacterium RIFOXYD1_FULL_53_11]